MRGMTEEQKRMLEENRQSLRKDYVALHPELALTR